jgi:hypothetical protein
VPVQGVPATSKRGPCRPWVTNHEFPPGQIDILDPQAQRFQQSQAGAVEQTDHERHLGIFNTLDQAARFIDVEDGGQTRGFLSAYHVVQPRQFLTEHLLVKEENRAQRLILGGSANVALRSEMTEKSLDLGLSHFGRVPAGMENHETLYPIGICLLGSNAIVQRPQAIAQLIQQARLGRHGKRRGRRRIEARHG